MNLSLLIGIAIGAGAVVSLLLLPSLIGFLVDQGRDLGHRRAVRRAVAEGWTVPAMDGNWSIRDNGAPMRGVTGVSHTPDLGVEITHYAEHARRIQRRVEEAWLQGIRDAKRKTGDIPGVTGTPADPAHPDRTPS